MWTHPLIDSEICTLGNEKWWRGRQKRNVKWRMQISYLRLLVVAWSQWKPCSFNIVYLIEWANNNNIYIYIALIQSSKCFISNYKLQQLRVLVCNSDSNIFETLRNALDVTDEPHYYPALYDKCVGCFKSPNKILRYWTYGLTSLSEKTRRSNHLQMLEQRQHHLLNYFKTLSVGPAGNRTRASRTADWCFTN